MLVRNIITYSGSRGWKLFGCLLMMMLCAKTAFCQTVSEQYVVNHWTTQDGLPVNSINDIIQSKNGFLWIATFDGLIRFDGVHFKVFTSAHFPELQSNRIYRIVQAKDSSLWFITEPGYLVKYQNGVFHHIGPQDGLNGTLAYNLTTGPKGFLWIGSDKGISVYRNGVLSDFKPKQIGGIIYGLYLQNNGSVWIRNRPNGLIYRFSGESLTSEAHVNSFHEAVPFTETGDTLWLGTGSGLYRFWEIK